MDKPLGVMNLAVYSFCMFPIATTTCHTVSSVQTCVTYMSTDTPIYTQDSGDLQYMLAWVIFFLAIVSIGAIFTTLRGIFVKKV